MGYNHAMTISRVVFCAAALAILAGGGCFRLSPNLSPTSGAQNQNDVAPLAILVLDGGHANVTRGDATESASDELELLPGDTIEVTDGTVRLVYPEAGASYLEAGSKVTVLPDGEGQGSVFAQIELVAGGIWTRFERLLGPDEKFSVSGNGVVATVRGTAFGVELVNGSADVQVAESNVDVTVLEARKDLSLAAKAIRLSPGQGLRIGAESLKKLEVAGAKRLVRTLGATEKAKKGFKFAVQKLPMELLKKRLTRVRLDRPLFIPVQYRDRIDPSVLERLLKFSTSNIVPSFTAPTRLVSPAEIAPSTTPSTR